MITAQQLVSTLNYIGRPCFSKPDSNLTRSIVTQDRRNMASKTTEVNETDFTPLQCKDSLTFVESKSESSPEPKAQSHKKDHEVQPTNLIRELAPLRKVVLACLACIIKQDKNPLSEGVTLGAPEEL